MDSENCQAGLFSRRNPLSLPSLVVRGRQGEILGLTRIDIWLREAGLDRDSKGPPLLQRGWVFQELALSPRTLCYCSEVVCWECHECIACENDPVMRKSMTQRRWHNHSMKKQVSDLVSIGQPTKHSVWLWHKIVQRYTSTKVTFGKDRWVAFSGLANLVQAASGFTMTAGLWRERFPLELAWRSSGCGRRINSHFPTWSWISLDTIVQTEWGSHGDQDRERMLYMAEVVDVPSQWHDPLLRGSAGLARCAIKLKGPSREFTSTRDVYGALRTYDFGQSTEGSHPLYWKPDVIFVEGQRTWVLQLFCYEKQEGTALGIFGIVVIPSEDDPDLWVRIGSLHIWSCKVGADGKPLPLGELRTITLI